MSRKTRCLAGTLLFFTVSTCATTPTWQSRAVAQDLRPRDPIDYKPMFPDTWKKKNRTPRMVPWEGKEVVFLTTTADLDPGVMARFLERVDGGWKLYADYIGKAPRPHFTHNNKPTIAAVPDASYTCGVGCGFIGATGIELGGFYNWDYPSITKQPDSFPHYVFYEMGRNYFLFQNRHSAFTTGFAVFMRYVCMDALKCLDTDTATRRVIEQAESHLKDTDLTFLQAFTSTAGMGEKVHRLKGIAPSDQPVMYASAMLKLRRDHGGDEWLKRFYKFLWQCPNIPRESDPKDAALAQGFNWLVAASCAAGQDLTPVFADRWRMPLGKGTRDALAKFDWKRPDLSATAVLRSLPPDELPASLKSILTGDGATRQRR